MTPISMIITAALTGAILAALNILFNRRDKDAITTLAIHVVSLQQQITDLNIDLNQTKERINADLVELTRKHQP